MGRVKREIRERQCEQFVAAYDGFERINEVLDAQFHSLHTRAQVVVGISGVLLTASVLITTGKIIARSEATQMHLASRLLIAAGISDILSAAIAIGGVLRVRWMTPP